MSRRRDSGQCTRLTDAQLALEFAARPGLIPVDIDGVRRELIWVDLDRYHCYEGFFDQSLRAYSALRKTADERFVTSLDVLASLPLTDSLAPSGFIFHGGRCGSTLLAKVLARSRTNLVFSEARPHNAIWKLLNGSGSGADLYRNLVLAMGRRRLASYQEHFIKFTSCNILHFSHIRASFPDTRALFLFRQPDAVLESFERRNFSLNGRAFGLNRTWPDGGAALEDFYREALCIRDTNFRCLDYADLQPDNLPAILKFFGAKWAPEEVRLMRCEFRWDSKSGVVPIAFRPRPVEGPKAGPGLRDAYCELMALAASGWGQRL